MSAGLHASKLARNPGLRRAYRRRRPTTPRASTTRSPAARRSSGTSIRCRTAPGSACTRRWTSAAAASSAPTSNGSPRSTTRFEPEKLDKFLDFIRTYYPGLDATRLHPDYTGIRPKLYREGEPVPDFAIHGPTSTAVEDLVVALRHREPRPHGVAGDRRGRARPAALSATRCIPGDARARFSASR